MKVKDKLVWRSEELYNLTQQKRASYGCNLYKQLHAFYAPAVLAKLIKANDDDDVTAVAADAANDTAAHNDDDGQNDDVRVRKGCN